MAASTDGESWVELEDFVQLLIDTGNASLGSEIDLPNREALQRAVDKLGKLCATIKAIETRRRYAAIRTTANTRSKTRIGSTTASGAYLRSPTTCRANPMTVPTMAMSHSDWRTRSSRIFGEASVRSYFLTRLVLRCSATDVTPNTSAAPTAAATPAAMDTGLAARPLTRPYPPGR